MVTGGSGFIASYCIIALLNSGYSVKATLRSLKKAELVKQMLIQGGIQSFDDLSFAEADLAIESSWKKAIDGCHYVIHVASPTPYTDAKTEDDFVIPAKNGVLFVLRAAGKAGVKRVVLTSAFGAVGFGTVNATGVPGPILSDDFSHSIQNIKQMLSGDMKACPKLISGYVDVRDVADLHLKAMTMPQVSGQRFIAVAGDGLSLLDIAKVVRKNLDEKAAKVPTNELPNWLIKLLALFIPKLKAVEPYLGMVKRASSEKAITLPGRKPRSAEEAILATANSLVQLGIIK